MIHSYTMAYDTHTHQPTNHQHSTHLNKASARAGFPTWRAVFAQSCRRASRRTAEGTEGTVSEQKHSAARAVAFDPARHALTDRPAAAKTSLSFT